MTQLDQFESVFRAADKAVFRHEDIRFDKVLVVTDRSELDAKLYGDQVRKFLSVIDSGEGEVDWRNVHGDEFKTVKDLLDLVEEERPALIVTYRHLHSETWKWPFSLGEHLDVLTQATTTPVLVMPHPDAQRAAPHAFVDTNRVMAITDHLAGDERLVNWGVRMTEPKGTLFLAHVEDERAFERLMTVISKIPEIDTETARDLIHKKLLEEAADYIGSCRKGLGEDRIEITIEEVVTQGHQLAMYKGLIERHQLDLLVLNTKDEDQLAMHGMAYPLAIEIREIPLLML